MKLEEIIFRSTTWGLLKDHIPSPLRSFMASGLLKAKRGQASLKCLFLMPKYIQNWPSSMLKELFLSKNRFIQYRLKNLLKLTIRAKSYDKFIVQEIYTGSYDIALKELPKSPVVIDAGAHIGVFATKVVKDYPLIDLFCVEPITENLKLLRKNLDDNNLSNSVTIINGLLSKEEGIKTIYGRKEHSAGFNLYMPTEVKYKVRSYTLESLMLEHKITHCDLIKLDIEGGEYEVLNNTPSHVFQRIKSIIMEYHPFPKESADIIGLSDFLSKNGYSLNFYSQKMLYATKVVK